MQVSTITVLGTGYVGLTTAALLAHAGYKVYALEPNQKRLDVIKQGRSFFYEAGLDPVIKAALESGQFIPTDSYEDSVPNSDIVFSCVGTPDNPDGSSNLTYVYSAATEAARLMQDGTIYVQKSTVPVGTGAKVQDLFDERQKQLSYVSNPEFLREGTALEDTLYFDRVVVGGANQEAVQTVIDVYRQLEASRAKIAATASIAPPQVTGEYIATELASAELIKVTANAFLALKISFANSIAKLSDKAGADIIQVMDAVGADKRIGRAFLNAGRGYGGGCFPKDVSGLIASGLDYGVDLKVMQAVQDVNASMPGYVAEKLREALQNNLANKRVAVLGLAFKAGTSDARRSPGVAIANLLIESGARVTAYDPKANEEAAEDLDKDITLTESAQESMANCEAVVIATEWQEFADLTVEDFQKANPNLTIIDAVNKLDKKKFQDTDLRYFGIGR